MKISEKEYREYIMKNDFGRFRRLFFILRIFILRVKDLKRSGNNNDYSYEMVIGVYNPLSYIFLLIWSPLYFLVNGCNKDSYLDLKKQLGKHFKK
jgi:hypothetical protein